MQGVIVAIKSLPSREAWIEITIIPGLLCREGESLPSREAWIEIPAAGKGAAPMRGRFPRGKRGLKFAPMQLQGQNISVASLAGSVD